MRRRFWAPGRARDANGVDWLGKKVTESGDVALILGEGGFDAGDRLKAWLHGNPRCTADRMPCAPSKKVST